MFVCICVYILHISLLKCLCRSLCIKPNGFTPITNGISDTNDINNNVIHIYIYISTRMFPCMYECVCIHIYISVYVCVYMCLYDTYMSIEMSM